MIDAETNRIGAMVIALGDRLRAATEEAIDMPASYPAALSALRTWAGGSPVEALADGLRVSHSRAVRVVDRLASDGLARRVPYPGDGRAVGIELTAAGRRAADRVQAARTAALEDALAALTPSERAQLGELAATVLGEVTEGRRTARGICRLCDPHACGHWGGDCPVTRAADRAEQAAAA